MGVDKVDHRTIAVSVGAPTTSAGGRPRPSAAAVALDESSHATRRSCSWNDAGWRSALLRCLDNHAEVDCVELPATDDQLLVLVTRGEAVMEASQDGGAWRRCSVAPGSLGMTAPGRQTSLRWRTMSPELHRTLHLYVSGEAVAELVEGVWGRDVGAVDLPDALSTRDPLVEETMLAMARAAVSGAGDLYAEAALPFLTVHLLTRWLGVPEPREPAPEDARVRVAIDYMNDNLALPLTLAELAAVVGLSAFHFAHVFKTSTGQPPHRYLTRLRIDAARRHLARGNQAITDIAYLCGFSSPAHFAAAFRKCTGVSPSIYRQERQGADE